uniref:Amidohydrolase-related domain-containing protein n=1 Tax=Corethron hystrix TaxID=216773 RepID=A0A7S1FP47_9STRA|mmetsp:Transcript_19938/g.45257  ORF Transcript_19938/g.45257 Transcript_19938/m.45257 type:complete len:519 (+) Transcript_19938:79-1635(+)
MKGKRVFHGTVALPVFPSWRSSDCTEPCHWDKKSPLGTTVLLENQVIVVSLSCGKIEAIGHASEPWAKKILQTSSIAGASIDSEREENYFVELGPSEIICPGFVDCHIHAPQFSYCGTATDRPLMGPDGWLEKYTFPAERSLGEDAERARHVFESVVDRTLRCGTTTACYFATVKANPTKILVDVMAERGQRGFAGNVCMDRCGPGDYIMSTEENIAETREVIEFILSHGSGGIVQPIITPRFIPSCTPQLMEALGNLKKEYDERLGGNGIHVQSHISESDDEVIFSREIDLADRDLIGVDGAASRTDTEIFDSHGLLSRNCMMAHGTHLTDSDLSILGERGVGIAHCALSNYYFSGRTLHVKHLLEKGVRVGMGTDVAGGYSPSMMDAARCTVVASRGLQQTMRAVNDAMESIETRSKGAAGSGNEHIDPTIDYLHAFYLATLGGASALGIHEKVGTFKKGMEFDAIILNVSVGKNICIFDTDNVQDIFQKLCTQGDDRNVVKVYVKGREVVNNLRQ